MREALLKIQGKAGLQNEDITDFTSVCKAEIKDDTIYIEYDESEISGTKDSVSTIFISGDTVTLNKLGSVVSTMAFTQGHETTADILTPMGNLKVNVFTNKLKFNVTDNVIKLELNYAFSLGGERIDNYLTLSCHLR